MIPYTIIFNPSYTNRSPIGIEISDFYLPIRHLLARIHPSILPKALMELSEGNGISAEDYSVKFFHECDEEDRNETGINENEILIFALYAGECTILERDFFSILLDYSIAFSKYPKSNEELDSNWHFLLENGIQKLSEKYQIGH